jgi:hypothetical protein
MADLCLGSDNANRKLFIDKLTFMVRQFTAHVEHDGHVISKTILKLSYIFIFPYCSRVFLE